METEMQWLDVWCVVLLAQVPAFVCCRIRIVHYIVNHTAIRTGGKEVFTWGSLCLPDVTRSSSHLSIFPEDLRGLLKKKVFDARFCLHEVGSSERSSSFRISVHKVLSPLFLERIRFIGEGHPTWRWLCRNQKGNVFLFFSFNSQVETT